jgi:Uma2 family endonuclease
MTRRPDPLPADDDEYAGTLECLLEAARRANWDAMRGPPHLRTGRFRPLRRVEYERLVDSGLLADEKVELLRGFMVKRPRLDPRHASAVERLTRILVLALAVPERATIRVQSPLALSDDSEPAPHLAAVPRESYKAQHPTRAFLVVEVGGHGRVTGPLYAESGITEYWIVDTAHERIEVHSEIVDGRYGRVTPYRRGETLVSAAYPELRIAIDELFA